MSTPVALSFDYLPVNTGMSNLGYTVPAEKFARVTVNRVSGTYIVNGVSISLGAFNEFWLKSGDTIATSGFAGAIIYTEYFNIT